MEVVIMVKIRLMRKGRKKKPLYRIVVIEDSNQRMAKVEDIGTYNPHVEPAAISVKEDRVKYWVSVGAQASNTVTRLLSTVGLMAYTPAQSSHQKVAKKDRQKEKADA